MKLLPLFLTLLCLCTPAHAQSHKPDIFALMDPNDGAQEFNQFLSIDTVDGIAVRLGWKHIQPQENSFDWSQLDSALNAARQHGKKITLHIAASPLGATPDWVFKTGAKSYSFSHPFMKRRASTEPLPWDTTYLKKWGAFLKALSQHIRSSGYENELQYISSAVPITEMSLLGCRNNKLFEYDYNRTAYIKAWHYSLLVLDKNFPTIQKFVSAPVKQICFPDRNGREFYNDVMTVTKGKKFSIFAADLNAQGSDRLNNLAYNYQNHHVGLQFIWSYSNDPRGRFKGHISDAVCKSVRTYNAKYIEFYKADLLNEDVGQNINSYLNCQ